MFKIIMFSLSITGSVSFVGKINTVGSKSYLSFVNQFGGHVVYPKGEDSDKPVCPHSFTIAFNVRLHVM